MKKLYSILIIAIIVSSLASCGHSPYKKRKACKGNGSWNGNRNLGYMVPLPDEKPSKKTYYVGSKDNLNKEKI